MATWDPRLPPLSPDLEKHWRSIVTMDPYLKKVFPEPPIVANKRTKNIKDFIIRAKIPEKSDQRPKRQAPGMKMCHLCPYIMKDKTVKTETFEWKLENQFNCETENVVYLIICMKCNLKYIGESERKLKD